MAKTKKADIKVPSTFMSTVDIIIPFHGQYETVTKLVESIYRLTRTNYFNICLVDDCSPNADYLATVTSNITRSANRRRVPVNFQAVRTEEQKGFAGAMKAGLDVTKNAYVCFMNSDCLIEDSNWLRAMGETLLSLKSENVRMVAPMTESIVGGDPSQKGNCSSISQDIIIPSDSHLSWYCVLSHRELFTRCGGFLKEYPLGMYEDEEFAARMLHYGFKQAVCRHAWIGHEGEATIRNLWKSRPETQKIMTEDNRRRCIEDMRRLRQK